jgi:hypothetical protein
MTTPHDDLDDLAKRLAKVVAAEIRDMITVIDLTETEKVLDIYGPIDIEALENLHEH